MINQAVILCGGKGTRLKINTAKCLAVVCGEPILAHIIREFQNQNINKFHFCLGFYSDDVLKYLNTISLDYTYSLDPEEYCGTWKALQNAKDFVDEEFFATYGDSVAFCDLELMYWQYVESGQNSMMSVSNFGSKDSNFEIVNGEIGFQTPNYVEHGVSIFQKKCLDDLRKLVNVSQYFKCFQSVHFANANYYQVNTPEDLRKVNQQFNKFKESTKYNFLDRDGTINVHYPDFYQSPDFHPIEKILELIDDSDCVIITNQPDRAKNIGSVRDINFITEKARQYLIDNGKNVLFTQSCLHRDVVLPEDEFHELRFDCDCRKPKDGMLHKSAIRLNISKDSVFYGDSECDEECAKNYGLNFVRMV